MRSRRPGWRRRRATGCAAPYYRWLFFAAGPLEAAATNKAFGLEVPAERKAMAGYGSLADVLDALEAAVSGREYLVGDRFTAADVYVGSHIGWGMKFGTIEKRPAFERYFARLGTRPAAVRAREIDDALVADAKRTASRIAPGARRRAPPDPCAARAAGQSRPGSDQNPPGRIQTLASLLPEAGPTRREELCNDAGRHWLIVGAGARTTGRLSGTPWRRRAVSLRLPRCPRRPRRHSRRAISMRLPSGSRK